MVKLSPRIKQSAGPNGSINLSIDGYLHIGRLDKSPRSGRWMFFPTLSEGFEATILQSIADGLVRLNGRGL